LVRHSYSPTRQARGGLKPLYRNFRPDWGDVTCRSGRDIIPTVERGDRSPVAVYRSGVGCTHRVPSQSCAIRCVCANPGLEYADAHHVHAEDLERVGARQAAELGCHSGEIEAGNAPNASGEKVSRMGPRALFLATMSINATGHF